MAAGVSWTAEGRRMTPGAKLARTVMLSVSVAFLGLLLLAPLGAVLVQALAKGFEPGSRPFTTRTRFHRSS